MFTKLLKHEFRAVSKPLFMMSAGCLLAGIIGGLLNLILTTNVQSEENPFLIIVSSLLLMGIYFILIAYMIGSSILLYYRFYKHKFSDEGYLTFTLPVSTHQILLSSILNYLICNLIILTTYIFSILMILLPAAYQSSYYFPSDIFEVFYIMQEEMQYIFGNGHIIASILSIIASAAYSIILPMLSITIGSIVAKKHKILAAVGIGYGISMAVSIVTGILTVAEIIMIETITTQLSLSLVIVIPSVLMLGISVGGYFLMHHFIDKKLNL